MQLPKILEIKGMRVLTTKQLAEAYQTSTDTIKSNFNANRCRFVEGKHYIAFVGDELKEFKKQVRDSYLVANRASHLYLWTEKGALLHAKSLNTDKAWQVYDYLVDFYFRTKEEMMIQNAVVPQEASEVSVLNEEDIKRIGINRGIVLGVYRAECEQIGYRCSIMEIYDQLSAHGKALVQSLIFGEEHYAK